MNELTDDIKQKIIGYTVLATQSLQDSGSNEPTEEMNKLAAEIGMSHNEIIQLAAELTLGNATNSS